MIKHNLQTYHCQSYESAQIMKHFLGLTDTNILELICGAYFSWEAGVHDCEKRDIPHGNKVEK